MKFNNLRLPFSLVLGMFLAVSLFAQNKSFSDANVEYTFEIPNETWKITANPSDMNPNVEFVYGDKMDGHLEIRKLSVKAEDMLSDVIANEENKLKFMQGYVAGREENFSGVFPGRVFNFEYIRSTRNMSGRFYFLRANDTTVYVIRFSGERDKLRAIRNQTDSIARTFQIKKK